MIDSSFFTEAVTNNTFSYEALCETISNVKENSFNYLYGLQSELAGITRFDFKSNDLKKMDKNSYSYTVKFGFIGEAFRNKFYHSSYINKPLKQSDINGNIDFFDKSFLCFINGFLIDTIEIQPEEDKTTIIFDLMDKSNKTGIPLSFFKDMRENNRDITIFFIPNTRHGIFNTNKYALEEAKNTVALQRIFENTDIDSSKILVFINSDLNKFSSVLLETKIETEGTLTIFSNMFKTQGYSAVKLNVFAFEGLREIINLNDSNRFFMAKRENMPIPTSSFIIFENIDGIKRFAHNLSIKLYYPNIYEIEGDFEGNLEILEFYNETPEITLKYKNDLEVYYNYNKDVINKFSSGTIPSIIKNYKPMEFKFDIEDFNNYEFFRDDFRYRVDTLKKWIENDNELANTYLQSQYKKSKNNFIHVIDLNLPDRLRRNNSDSIADMSEFVEFEKDTYIFAIKNFDIKSVMQLRFFIDGRLVNPLYSKRKDDIIYCYLPAEFILNDSIIEIERFDDYLFSAEFTPTDEINSFEFELKTSITPVCANDIFITYEDTTYIDNTDNENFEIIIKPKDEETSLSYDSFLFVSNVRLRIINSELLDKKIKIWVKKKSYYESQVTKEQEIFSPMVVDFPIANDNRCFRIFKNGFLLPADNYNIDFSEKMDEINIINFNILREIGEEYTFDSTTHKYHQIYFSKTIDEKGYVDLTGFINKPIDARWYDIYVNGRKIRNDQMEIISPTKFFLKNVDNRINLDIYEKDRDMEYFNIENGVIMDDVLNNVSGLFELIYDEHEKILNKREDILNVIIPDIEIDLVNFFNMFMIRMFINPDLNQITNEMRRIFPNLFTLEEPFFINPDLAPTAVNVLAINPE